MPGLPKFIFVAEIAEKNVFAQKCFNAKHGIKKDSMQCFIPKHVHGNCLVSSCDHL